jgi:hypothetical protein
MSRAASARVVASISPSSDWRSLASSSARQRRRSGVGGVKPTRKLTALSQPRTLLIRIPAVVGRPELSCVIVEPSTAPFISTAAPAIRRIRRRATPGCPRPARHMETATPSSNRNHHARNEITNATNQEGCGWPGSG